jgi:phosphoglycolate phosphatase
MTALVVFDLDGTLVDSSRDLTDAVNALIVDLGGQALGLDQVTDMVGEGAAVLVRRALLAAALDPDTPGALDRFLAYYHEGLTTHTRPYAGIPEALASLGTHGATLAVLTNKPQRPTLEILERLDLAPAFSQVIGGDTAAGRKPDPAGLQEIIGRAGATPASTLLVGDSPIDLATARRGGTGICLARYGFGYRFAPEAFRGDELFVDAPSEIPSVVLQQ